MAYRYFNPNPSGKRVGDCVIRGISFLTGDDWEKTYLGIAIQGFETFDMPSSNAVWAEYLRKRGYKRYVTTAQATIIATAEILTAITTQAVTADIRSKTEWFRGLRKCTTRHRPITKGKLCRNGLTAYLIANSIKNFLL